MAWQVTPYTLPLAASALASAVLFVVIYRSREKRAAMPLLGVLTSAVIWSLADGIRLSSTNRALKIAMNDLRFLGPILATVSAFLFAAAYTNREQWLSEQRVMGLFSVHVVTFVLVITNAGHNLVRESVTFGTINGMVLMEISWGPWYYVHAIYSYALLVATAYMFVRKYLQSGDLDTYRGQTLTILVGTFVPWGMNAAFIADITEVDLTAIGFTVTGGMFAVAIFRYQFLELIPIARSTVVDNVDEGYLVLDTGDSVVDVNRKAAEIIGTSREEMIGQQFQSLFATFPKIRERFADTRDTRDQIRLEREGVERFYDVDVSPIYDQRNCYTGRVVLFRDVTEQEQRKRQLEQQKTKLEHQNERLEDFANIVSHDLRNPLNVIQSRIELARRDPDDIHFDSMDDSVDRMETIIDDVLSMARQGQTVEETERIDLANLCRYAWRNVDAQEASLNVTTTHIVDGDRARLLQVLENLFRNAIDHGREDVTIAVGDLADGFYIEDDGPGIPEEKREAVFEKGYTTAKDGTGFGLSIVQTAIEAHGWEISVGEGINGGARFEITGMQIDSEPETASAMPQD